MILRARAQQLISYHTVQLHATLNLEHLKNSLTQDIVTRLLLSWLQMPVGRSLCFGPIKATQC